MVEADFDFFGMAAELFEKRDPASFSFVCEQSFTMATSLDSKKPPALGKFGTPQAVFVLETVEESSMESWIG
jgi:hypothetical protein